VAVFCSFYLKRINNMKVKKFTIGLVALGGVILGSNSMFSNQEQAYYPKNTTLSASAPLAKGMAEYYKMLRADASGEIPVDEVLRIRKRLQANYTQKAANINWQEMGPDNVGGRTRALIVDNQNPNRYIAGAVSGGLWISENRGNSWTAYNNNLDNMAIADLAQAPDGTIYFGTGPLFDGTGNSKGLGSEMIGEGVFKMIGNGQVQQLAAPSFANNRGIRWSGVNHLAVDPTNSNRIYVAQVDGLMMSSDAGLTWKEVIPSVTSACQDVDVASNGKVVAAFGNNIYLSPSGDSGTFVNSPLPIASSRTEIAIAPSNPNVIYASATISRLSGIVKSIDGGQTWTVIGPGGTTSFDPFCSSQQCQGGYDNAIAVSTTNSGHILVGGVTLWEWKQAPNDNFTGSWAQIAYNFGSAGNPNYVHSDIHRITFTSGTEALIGTDGGVFRSSNLVSQTPQFVALNNGYNVTQFYDIGVGPTGKVLGGTQDNGSIMVGFNFNQGRSGIQIRGGDGFDSELSALVPEVGFASLYYGKVLKMTGIADNVLNLNIDGGNFYNSDLSGRCSPTIGTAGCGPFYTSFKLWETFNDVNSRDTLELNVRTDKVYYNGDTILLPSQTRNRFIKHAVNMVADTIVDSLPANINVTFKGIVDRYQSMAILANAAVSGSSSSLHITRDAVKSIASTEIEWFRIAGATSKPDGFDGTVISMAVSRDGDIIYAGTSGGDLYRISGLNAAWSADDYAFTTASSIIKCKKFGRFSGRAVTGIAVDPNNADNVIVTCGNYSNQVYVYRSTFATTAGDPLTSFESIQGTGLDKFPTYSAVIDKRNNNSVVIGTEFGVYATENAFTANANDVVWTEENAGLARVPVYEVQQQVFGYQYASNSGMIYAGSHGRGIFKSDKFVSAREIDASSLNTFESKIKMYPNPVVSNATLEFTTGKSENLTLTVYDLSGRIVQTKQIGNTPKGNQKIQLELNGLSNGSYFLTLRGDTETKTAKFIVAK
jgi:hypothetical protein